MNLHLARYVDRWVGLPLCALLYGAARLSGERLPPLGATTPPSDSPLPRPRRMLAIKFYGLGNLAMILPVLQELQAAWPDIEIDVLTLPGNASLLEQSGVVRRVLTAEVTTTPRFVRSVWRLFGELRRGGYDVVFDFEQFLKVSGIFGFLTRAGRRMGLNTEGQQRAWLYTTRIAYTDSEHTVDVFRRLSAPFGVAGPRPTAWRLPVPDGARDAARARLAAAGLPSAARLVVIHIGTGPNYATVAVKRWDVERFAALADRLVERHGVSVVFTGQGAEERDLVRTACGLMRHGAVDLCDQLDVPALTGVIAEASFVIANDTSVVHLAGIIGTPVVALFGPTAPSLYGPRGDHDLVFYKQPYCSPCISNYNLKLSRCTDPVCMRSITVDEVAAGIEANLLRPAAGAAAGR
jgi:ADP-heptose:LPS heptosyltransferase